MHGEIWKSSRAFSWWLGVCKSREQNTNSAIMENICNPFGPFWDELGVNFDSMKAFTVAYHEPERWVQRFSPSEYPVVALKGAPASFPMATEHRALQQYMEWSDSIVEQGQRYIQQNFPGRKYVGIHLRNGPDWEKACGHLEGGLSSFMASPQCINPRSSEKEHVEETGATVVYVATDKNPLIHEIGSHLADLKVSVFHQDPWLPQLDLYILGEADHFIGNCVSSFTSFVARARTVHNKPTSFWAVR
ncbi:OFUT1-like protein [Mya arenaria]|uniref:GDP-fucose protein O-fucosyltransferase 1 n=1 Tax=Mya arenaria TaxID=6604 RepID=A0ABY7FSW2_MYAAR|nr:OFUT1-like protein [Mya arenaria]